MDFYKNFILHAHYFSIARLIRLRSDNFEEFKKIRIYFDLRVMSKLEYLDIRGCGGIHIELNFDENSLITILCSKDNEKSYKDVRISIIINSLEIWFI